MQGRYRVTLHARQRMAARMISDNDVIECGRTSYFLKQQIDGKYKVKGLDLDGEELTILCVWDGETILVTLF